MGLFSFTQEIAMDLGTANSIIIHNDKIVVDQPSVVAIENKTDKLLAVGETAHQMEGKEPPGIRTIRPLRDGVIADFNAAEQMIRGMVKMVNNKRRWFSPAGGRDVYMIYEPMAAALGIGIDVEAPEGNMIVDIGGGSTEIAVISLGGIVSNKSIRTAGNDLTADIQAHMANQHNVKVGSTMAEQIKINVGSAIPNLENPPEPFVICGPNKINALPMEVAVTHDEIAHCIDKTIQKMENAIRDALEQTPPELYADVVRNGIYLAGGGALLRGLAKRFSDKFEIEFKVPDDPLHAVAKGTGVALKNINRFSFLIR